MRMVYMSTNLRPEQHEQLKRLSDITKVPYSHYVREAIDLVLELPEYRRLLDRPPEDPSQR